MNKIKKKILITGGAGFVGSHLCERLAQNKNNEVYSLDNYFTGSKDNHIKKVNYIEGNTSDIKKLITFKPDMIYHLGEYSRVEQSFDDIKKVWEYNINGTFAVLEFVKNIKCKIIYAGSSTKFADTNFDNANLSDEASGANASPYAWSKSTNTQLVKNYASWFGLSYAITYFYNVYGPREIQEGKYATLIALYKRKMQQKESLGVVSPGTQRRNFTHIDDTIDALELIGQKGQGDEYGIGSDESYSILDIGKMYGGKIVMLPPRKGNRMSAQVITNKTKNLGWKPKRSIKEYINSLKQQI